MSYNSDFDRSFMERSLKLVKEYEGPFDATLLLNCLLGLLIVPKESCLQAIPMDPIDEVQKWGISPRSIESYGQFKGPNDDPHTLRGLVCRLRNAVAHFRFEPRPARGEVQAFHFHDSNGFKATLQLSELRVFVERLAAHLKGM